MLCSTHYEAFCEGDTHLAEVVQELGPWSLVGTEHMEPGAVGQDTPG